MTLAGWSGKVDSPRGDLEQPAAAGDLTSHDLDFTQGRSSARPFNTRPSASQPSAMASTLKAPTREVRMGRKGLASTKMASLLTLVMHLTLLLPFQCSCT